MTARIERGLALKWTSVLTLFTILPLIITDLTIVQVYREELKGSLIAVEGIVLIMGVLFSFFLASKLALPFEEPPKDKLPSEAFYSGYAGKKRP